MHPLTISKGSDFYTPVNTEPPEFPQKEGFVQNSHFTLR